jgi:hypothetical protein
LGDSCVPAPLGLFRCFASTSHLAVGSISYVSLLDRGVPLLT